MKERTRMRTEHDSMGEVKIPRNAYYGPQTQRAVNNFPISGRKIPPDLIRALGLVKWAAATVNHELRLLKHRDGTLFSDNEAKALIDAAWEVHLGKFDAEFPVDIYQTGSGTSSNMNANEVIANRALEILGRDRFCNEKSIHPNDHVNFGQSTNDIFPTAIHVAVAVTIKTRLLAALRNCTESLLKKAEQWTEVLKIGRTHLADATPLTLGQEIGGFARQAELALNRTEKAMEFLWELPVGGTAVGTGINTHSFFGDRVAKLLAEKTKIPFVEAVDHFEANAQRDGLVAAHSLLKTVAITYMNIANNIRILASGPRCGIYELILSDLQPGSSIMPGKVNPVLCESLMQVAAKVIGNDTTLTTAGTVGGQFQLNIMMPLMGDTVLESVTLLSEAVALFDLKCVRLMQANHKACREGIEKSLALATALNTIVGYEKAAAIVKEAFHSGRTIREVCEEQKIAAPDVLDKTLDPSQMIRPFDSE